MSYLKLVFIRHAQSIGNQHHRMEGQTSTDLSPAGVSQAADLATQLVDGIDTAPVIQLFLYTSPLKRAQQTTSALVHALEQTDISFTPRSCIALQELHGGIFQGLTWAEATTTYPDLCQQLLKSRQWQPVPEAESPQTARQRARRWLQTIRHRHRPGDTLWVISHAGIMQHLIAEVLGCDRTWKLPIDHTGRFEFWLSATHWQALTQDRYNPEYWLIKRFNDCSHLTHEPAPISGILKRHPSP